MAVIFIGCLVYPMVVNIRFSFKYNCNILEPFPIILSSSGLILVGLTKLNQSKLLPGAIIFAIVLYMASLFLVKRDADEFNCSIGDKLQIVIANALLPVSIFGVIMLIIILIFVSMMAMSSRRKR